jgi:hypothetical protein
MAVGMRLQEQGISLAKTAFGRTDLLTRGALPTITLAESGQA